MNERTPKHDPQAHELLMDLSARIIVELTGSDLPEEARLKALEVVLETSRGFIYEKTRPALTLVK